MGRGIFPGRVVWAHDPLATKWQGRWQINEDQWWLDKNTDPQRVANMLSQTIQKVSGETTDADAWREIFSYYNSNKRNLDRGYQPGEVVAVKVNLKNSLETEWQNHSDFAHLPHPFSELPF